MLCYETRLTCKKVICLLIYNTTPTAIKTPTLALHSLCSNPLAPKMMECQECETIGNASYETRLTCKKVSAHTTN